MTTVEISNSAAHLFNPEESTSCTMCDRIIQGRTGYVFSVRDQTYDEDKLEGIVGDIMCDRCATDPAHRTQALGSRIERLDYEAAYLRDLRDAAFLTLTQEPATA